MYMTEEQKINIIDYVLYIMKDYKQVEFLKKGIKVTTDDWIEEKNKYKETFYKNLEELFLFVEEYLLKCRFNQKRELHEFYNHIITNFADENKLMFKWNKTE